MYEEECKLPCLKCSDNKKVCLECSLGYYLNQINDTASCEQCKYFCKTCVKQNECTSCIADSITNRYEHKLCPCKKGYFDNGTSMKCLRCPYQCDSCENNKCTSCIADETTHRDNNPNCSCKTGYYDDGQSIVCQKCPYYCKTCLNNHNGYCTTCDTSSFRIDTSSNPTNLPFKCICQDGYYDDGQNVKCVQCPYQCKKCSFTVGQEVKCTECFDQDTTSFRLALNPVHQCLCQDGYYDDTQDVQCKQCPYNCKTCEFNNNIVVCLSCPDQNTSFRSQIQDSNNCSCIKGYFDGGNIQCQACHPNCLTCNAITENNCLTCNNTIGRTLIENQCKCIGNYQEYSPPTKNCQQKFPCSLSCLTCKDTGPTNCLSCSENRIQIIDQSNQKNQCKCITGYFEEQNTQKCQICHESCSECSGKEQSNCINCKDMNRIVINGICICKDGFIEVNGQCLACHETCKKCKGTQMNECIECEEKHYRQIESTNQCTCKQGYLQINLQSTCQKCNPFCKTCDSQSSQKCVDCRKEDYRTLNQVNSQCECNKGYFQLFDKKSGYIQSDTQQSSQFKLDQILSSQLEQNINSVCQQCSPICETCTDKSDNCIKCQPPHIFVNGKCVCPEGQYQDSKLFACNKCNDNCKTCESFTICLSCHENFVLNEFHICERIFPTNISKETLRNVYNVTESSTYVTIGATATGSVVLAFASLNTSIASQFLIMQKLNFLLFVNISYPELLYIFFKALGGTSPFSMLHKVDFFNKGIIKDSAGTPLPNKFTSENIPSSIFYNSGGSISILIVIWIIFGICLVLYRKNKLIQSKLQNMNTSAKLLKLIVEKGLSFVLVILHFIISLILSFSVAIQLTSVALSFDTSIIKIFRLIVAIILLTYLIALMLKTLSIVNNTKNYLIEIKGYYNDNVEGFVYRIINDVYRQDNILVRNYKVFYLVVENLLIPFTVSFFYFNFKVQMIIFLILQLTLCIVSCRLRPFKCTVSNIALIIEQVGWVIILVTIIAIGFCIEDILTRDTISNSEIQLMDGLSWVIVIFCLIILFSNPITVFIQVIQNYRIYIDQIKRLYFWVQVKVCCQESKCNEDTNDSSLRYLNDSFSKEYYSQKINQNQFLRNPKSNIPISFFDISSTSISPRKKNSSILKRQQYPQSGLPIYQDQQQTALPIRDSLRTNNKQQNKTQIEIVKINLVKQNNKN